jgi:hypothetical protein
LPTIIPTEPAHEAGDAVGALVELRVRDEALDIAIEIDDRDPVREAGDRAGEEVSEIGRARIHAASL